MYGSGYRIADEPKPGALERFAVDPMWPFFAIMFGGAWLSWPWFIVNGFAVGSPTRYRELAVAIGGLALSAAALFGLLYARTVGWLPENSLPYLILAVVVIKLGVTYSLHVMQADTFELYKYYGGVARNGFVVLIVAYLLSQQAGPRLLEAAPFLYILLA